MYHEDAIFNKQDVGKYPSSVIDKDFALRSATIIEFKIRQITF